MPIRLFVLAALAALLTLACVSGPFVRVWVCKNCPTSTIDRGDRGLVCENAQTHRWTKCGPKESPHTFVLVPDEDQVRRCP